MTNRAESLKLMQERTILYVEDDDMTRDKLGMYLANRVGRLLLASNGEEALRLFFEHQPDLVITDIQMPGLSGLELAERIKTVCRHTPVILTTAHGDASFLQQAITIGVDGFALKPTDLEQLIMVAGRCLRTLAHFEELERSRAILLEYHHASERERTLVASLMAKMMRQDKLNDKLVNYWISPADVVAGDLVGAARSPHGKLYFMLTDSTGHGLASTLNLLPVNHIFYDMVNRKQPVSLIVEEMNRAVKEQSPIERYVAAVVGAIDFNNRIVEIWNGGMPEVLFVERDGRIAHYFPSNHPPLGILSKDFNPIPVAIQYQNEGQICAYSDGLFDSCHSDDYPNRPLETFLDILARVDENHRLNEIKRCFTELIVGNTIQDDISVVMVKTSEMEANH